MNDNDSCNRCRFSIKKLVEMSEVAGTKEIFNTFGGLKEMNIYEVDVNVGKIFVRRSTGTITERGLAIKKLIRVHDMVHTGEVELDPHDIDYLFPLFAGVIICFAGSLRLPHRGISWRQPRQPP